MRCADPHTFLSLLTAVVGVICVYEWLWMRWPASFQYRSCEQLCNQRAAGGCGQTLGDTVNAPLQLQHYLLWSGPFWQALLNAGDAAAALPAELELAQLVASALAE